MIWVCEHKSNSSGLHLQKRNENIVLVQNNFCYFILFQLLRNRFLMIRKFVYASQHFWCVYCKDKLLNMLLLLQIWSFISILTHSDINLSDWKESIVIIRVTDLSSGMFDIRNELDKPDVLYEGLEKCRQVCVKR